MRSKRARQWGWDLVGLAVCLVMVFPVYWMVTTAFKPDAEKARILELNAKVNALIDSEIGVDNGSMYPGPTERYHTI